MRLCYYTVSTKSVGWTDEYKTRQKNKTDFNAGHHFFIFRFKPFSTDNQLSERKKYFS